MKNTSATLCQQGNGLDSEARLINSYKTLHDRKLNISI